MTAFQMAKAECANMSGEVCTGVNIGDDLSLKLMEQQGKRCVLSSGGRCAYFEQCVAPMVKAVTDQQQAKSYGEAVYAYRMTHPEFILANDRKTVLKRRSGRVLASVCL